MSKSNKSKSRKDKSNTHKKTPTEYGIDKTKQRYKNRGNLTMKELIKYRKTVDYAYHSGREKHIPGYNFCGPGTKYWIRTQDPDNYEQKMKLANKRLTGKKPYDKPRNGFDSCCKKHDKAYQICSTMKALKKADVDFIDCLKVKKDAYKKRRKLQNLSKFSREWVEYVALKSLLKGKLRLDDLNLSLWRPVNTRKFKTKRKKKKKKNKNKETK
jgi:hypothetical protein